MPDYLNVLPGKLRVELEKNVCEAMSWADAHGVPLVFLVPRPAEIVEQGGVGGHLWGRGPSSVDIEQRASFGCENALVAYKRSLSAFYAAGLEVEARR